MQSGDVQVLSAIRCTFFQSEADCFKPSGLTDLAADISNEGLEKNVKSCENFTQVDIFTTHFTIPAQHF